MGHQNLKFLQDTFLYTQKVCSWNFTSEMDLLDSNCPEWEFFYNLFLVSSCRTAIKAHFACSNVPLLVSDRTGFVWSAVCGSAEADGSAMIYLLGPTFVSETTKIHLRQLCRQMHLSKETIERLWKFIEEVPTISTSIASCNAGALHYCVNGSTVTMDEIQVQSESINHSEDATWGDVNWHGTWISEQRLFKSIMEGRFEDFSKDGSGNIGNIGGGDPLRQAKNEIIVFSVLCSRAAILGGVSSEGSLSLSDYFIQLVEAAETMPEVMSIGAEMHRTYVHRVQKVKANSKRSALVRACIEYVDTHILEKISLNSMAQDIGYNEHYISRKFKGETGESLFDYINQQKIQMAKLIFSDKKLSIAEVSDRLSFSSPSYFSSVFKRQTGISPVEYQQKYRKINKEDHPCGL